MYCQLGKDNLYNYLLKCILICFVNWRYKGKRKKIRHSAKCKTCVSYFKWPIHIIASFCFTFCIKKRGKNSALVLGALVFIIIIIIIIITIIFIICLIFWWEKSEVFTILRQFCVWTVKVFLVSSMGHIGTPSLPRCRKWNLITALRGNKVQQL